MSNAPTLQLVPRLSGTTGRRIASARKFHDLKQPEMLALMASIDPALTPSSVKTYSGWENDHKSPTVDEIRLIARATGFPVEDFVSDDDQPTDGPDTPADLPGSPFPWISAGDQPHLRRVA